jgi:serine/threonine protein kinase/tetratricopeptide (TPR) repeat protein
MEHSADQDQRVMSVLAAALKRPASERHAFLQDECRGDMELLREVTEAVDWEERMGNFLREPLIACPEMDRPFHPGEVVAGRFEIIREMGEGGMGVVYEAFDRKRKQRICVKTAKLGFRRALSPELEGALKVRHPNICVVNEIHTAQTPGGDVDFLTMEFLEGETLSEHLAAHGRLSPEDALAVARQLCAAVAEAHRSGIIHRDLKSGNVMLSRAADGGMRAVVTDFGLAGETSDLAEGLGTPRYMAPELWRGETATKRSDVYALGVVLYEMATGLGPGSYPAPPSACVQGLGSRWDLAVMPCLSPSAADRPEASDVLSRIEKKPRSKAPLAAAGIVLALAAIGAAIPGVRGPVMLRLYPPNVRLAILPLDAAPEAAVTGGGALQEASERIRRLQGASSTLVVIAPTDALNQGIHNPNQAREILHATHALQTALRREGDQWLVHGAVLNLDTKAQVREFSGRYTAATLANLPIALAGTVSAALRLRGASGAESLNPAAAGPYFGGLYYLRRDRRSFEQAIPLFQEAARLDARSVLPPAGLAEAQILKYQAVADRQWLDEAQRSLAAAQSLNPDSLRVLLVAGLLDQTAGRYEKALENYRRVQEREPRNTDALRRIAGVYDAMDMPDKAIASFKQAIALEPAYYAPYSELGVLYYFRGKYPEAAEQFRNTIARAPGSVQAYINLGAVMSDLGRDAEAEQALMASLRIKESAGAFNSMGAIRAYQKRDAEAVEFYRRAIALNARDFIYLLNLGDSYRRLGRAADAAAAYRSGMDLALVELKQNPRRGYTRAFAGYFAARLGDRARAQDEIAQALQFSPGDGKVIRRAVLTFQALGLTGRALDVLANATPELLQELGRHPDLAEFQRNPRFVQLTGNAGTYTGGR